MRMRTAFLVAMCVFALSPKAPANEPLEKNVAVGDLQISYRFRDEASAQKESEISRLVAQAFEAYTDMFGGLPRDLSGTDYTSLSIKVAHRKNMGGEADPQLIILNWNDGQLFGFGSWQTILLHELFHLWNAETFRYQDGQEHWFNEGVTEYYAYKTAVRLGLISPKTMLSNAAFPIGYYASSKGLGEISMREAGKTNKTKFANYFLVYHGGWVAAMVLDHDIRKRTNGTKSLDDLMVWMYENHPRHQGLYTLNDIASGLQATTGIDYADFFARYVDGSETIPVSDHLPLADALWAYEFKTHNRPAYRHLYETLGISDGK